MAFVRRISIVGDFFCWMWRGGNIREDAVLCLDIGEVREKVCRVTVKPLTL